MQDKGPKSLGKAIIFRAGQRLWACELNKVKEIVRTTHITPLPNALKGVLGVINVRGEVLPVLYTWPGQKNKRLLSNELYKQKKTKTIILLKDNQNSIGILVDEVKTLEEIHAYDLGEIKDESLCVVYLSNSGQIPLVDGKLIIEHLKSN